MDTWIIWVVPQGEVLWESHLITQGSGEDGGCSSRATPRPSMRGSGPTGMHLRVGGIPVGDIASGANIAGLPPNLHLPDGGQLVGG